MIDPLFLPLSTDTKNEKRNGENGISAGWYFADGRTLMGLMLQSCLPYENANMGTVLFCLSVPVVVPTHTWEGWSLHGNSGCMVSY